MFHHLTLAVRDRVVRELRDFWSDHPRYPDFAQNIQGKYSFEERPQFGMVVRTGGANNVVLSPDNFIGTVEGYVSLARMPNKNYWGSVDWVREDSHQDPDGQGFMRSLCMRLRVLTLPRKSSMFITRGSVGLLKMLSCFPLPQRLL